MINSELLRKKIDESGYKQSFIAKSIELTPCGLRLKISNKNEFKASEIMKLSELLSISKEERDLIFFD